MTTNFQYSSRDTFDLISPVAWTPELEESISDVWTTIATDTSVSNPALTSDSLELAAYDLPTDSLPDGRLGFALGNTGLLERAFFDAGESASGHTVLHYENGELSGMTTTVIVNSTAFIFEITSYDLQLVPSNTSYQRAAAAIAEACGDAILKTAAHGALVLMESIPIARAAKGAVKAAGLTVHAVRGGGSVVMPAFRAAAKSPRALVTSLITEGIMGNTFGLYEGVRDMWRHCP